MKQLVVDQEFKAYLPKLDDGERKLLEESLQKEGCRDAVVVWNSTIIDGHNRFEICTKHGIEFRTVSIEFESREDALDWMDRNAISRRNLDPKERALRIGRIYEREKKRHGGERGNQYSEPNPQVEDLPTGHKIAEEFGVSHATVERYGERARAHSMATEVEDEEAAEAAKDLPQSAIKRVLKKVKQSAPKPTKKPASNDEKVRKEQEKERKRIEREQAKAAAAALKEENKRLKEEAERKKKESQELAAKMTVFEKVKGLAVSHVKTTHELCLKMIQAGEDSMRKIDYLKAEKNNPSHSGIIIDIKAALSKADEIKAALKSIEARIEKWN